jgi:hypothetical protein
VSGAVDGDLVEVRIIGLPVQIADEASEHFAELSREFLHLANADEDVRRDVPGQLLELSDALRERFSSLTEANEERLAAAVSSIIPRPRPVPDVALWWQRRADEALPSATSTRTRSSTTDTDTEYEVRAWMTALVASSDVSNMASSAQSAPAPSSATRTKARASRTVSGAGSNSLVTTFAAPSLMVGPYSPASWG